MYARACERPDAEEPAWGAELRMGYDVPFCFRLNKPVVLASGEWVMPVTHAAAVTKDWFAADAQVQGVGISRDRGVTWSAGEPTGIRNPGSRFFIRRLASGEWLLINSPDPRRRTGIVACMSSDEGASWSAALVLDPRDQVSYPDAAIGADGVVYAVHDRDRSGAAEILLSRFRLKDVPRAQRAMSSRPAPRPQSRVTTPYRAAASFSSATVCDERGIPSAR